MKTEMTSEMWRRVLPMYCHHLQGWRTIVTARPQKYLCGKLYGDTLGKTTVLTRCGQNSRPECSSSCVFITHPSVFNAGTASVFSTGPSSHYTPLILCMIICAPNTVSCQLLDFILHHAHLAWQEMNVTIVIWIVCVMLCLYRPWQYTWKTLLHSHSFWKAVNSSTYTGTGKWRTHALVNCLFVNDDLGRIYTTDMHSKAGKNST